MDEMKDLHSRKLCIDWSSLITLLGTGDRRRRQTRWDIQRRVDLRWKLSGMKLDLRPWITIIDPVWLSTCFSNAGMTDAWRGCMYHVPPGVSRRSKTRILSNTASEAQAAAAAAPEKP